MKRCTALNRRALKSRLNEEAAEHARAGEVVGFHLISVAQAVLMEHNQPAPPELPDAAEVEEAARRAAAEVRCGRGPPNGLCCSSQCSWVPTRCEHDGLAADATMHTLHTPTRKT